MFWWDVNRMVRGMEWSGVDWDGKGDGGVKMLSCDWGWAVIGRLCVVCATTETCCKCNSFIQIHAPG